MFALSGRFLTLLGALVLCLSLSACSARLLDPQVWWRTADGPDLASDSGEQHRSPATENSASRSGSSRSGSLRSGSLQSGSDPGREAAVRRGHPEKNSVEPAPASRERAPVEVRVAQAFFDEEALHVKVHLKAHTELESKDVMVGVSGLNEGRKVEEHLQFLDKIVQSETIPAGSNTALHFTLSQAPLTEYQVRCSWGKDANDQREAANKAVASEPESRALLGNAEKGAKAPEAKTAALQPPEIEPESASLPEDREERDVFLSEVDVFSEPIECAAPPCDVYYTVVAAINNHSVEELRGVDLAVGLYWRNHGRLPKLPPPGSAKTSDEELIRLRKLGIAPGEKKRVKVRLDRAVPVIPGGAFVPHLRLLGLSD